MVTDLKDPDLYLQGVPYAEFRRLREATPVHWNEEADGPGFWSLLSYADIETVSKNPRVFSSAYANGGHRIFNEHEVAVANTGSDALGIPFISTDPPLHRLYRGIVQPGLSLARVRAMEGPLRERVRILLDRIEHGPAEFDFVSRFAAPFPLATLAELFGVPVEDSEHLYGWSNAMVGEDDPAVRVSPDQAAASLAAMLDYASFIYRDRRREPKDDILSLLANAELDGRPLSLADFLGTFVLLLVGGNETTRNSISSALIAFTEFRDQWALLGRRPELMPLAVREIVRWASPVLHMRRTATVETEIGGQAIAAGAKVVLWYAAGNRDPAVYSEPDAFRIDRQAPMHLGFGTGAHVCIGNRLAEVQIRVVLEELMARFPDIRACGHGRRLRSNFINGYLELPARVG